VSETHDETDVHCSVVIIEASGYEYHNYEMICLKKNIAEILVAENTSISFTLTDSDKPLWGFLQSFIYAAGARLRLLSCSTSNMCERVSLLA